MHLMNQCIGSSSISRLAPPYIQQQVLLCLQQVQAAVLWLGLQAAAAAATAAVHESWNGSAGIETAVLGSTNKASLLCTAQAHLLLAGHQRHPPAAVFVDGGQPHCQLLMSSAKRGNNCETPNMAFHATTKHNWQNIIDAATKGSPFAGWPPAAAARCPPC
jgi:hypothetical protein